MAATFAAGLLLVAPVGAQSLDERLDEETFLRGLVAEGLADVLETYLATHPPRDDVDVALREIARGEMAARRAAPGSTARAAGIDRVIRVRAALIDEHADDPRRGGWMADQAANLFDEVLPREGTGLTALYGIPTARQRDHAERTAATMLEMTTAAQVAVRRALREMEDDPAFERDAALRARRARLAREERDRRVPFLHGVAASFRAEIGGIIDAEREHLARAALDTLEPVLGVLTAEPAATARLYAALAASRRGRHETATTLLAERAARPGGDPYATFATSMAGVLLAQRRDGAEAALGLLASIEETYDRAPDDLATVFYRLLLADRRLLLERAIAVTRRARDRDDALVRAYTSYVERVEGIGALPRGTAREILRAKLGELPDDGVAIDRLPVIVAVARAERLARDAAGRPAAIDGLRAILRRNEGGLRDRDEARIALGRALLADGRTREAVFELTAMARERPETPEGADAIELALAAAYAAVSERGDDPSLIDALDDALAVFLASYVDRPSAARWLYVAGRRSLARGEPDEALRRFGAIPTAARTGLDARFMEVAARRARVATIASEAMRAAAHESVVEAVGAVMPQIESGLAPATPERRAALEYYHARLRVTLAESLAALGRYDDALAAVAGIEDEPGLDRTGLAAALRVRIEAGRATGRADAVRNEMARYLEADPGRAGPALSAMIASLLAEVEARLDAGDDAGARAYAEEAVVPLADLLVEWIATRDDRTADPHRIRAGDGYRLAGRAEPALRLYDAVAARQPDALEVLFGRAECLFALGRDRLGDAMRLYRRLGAAGDTLPPTMFWQSQLRMLQILDRAERNTDQIAPRIRRLRLRDPDLGGTRFKRAFGVLEERYG